MGLTPDNLLSGAVGAVIIFVLTVVYGAVVRTLQQGRELVGLSRVIRPEMERNVDALDIIHQIWVGQGQISARVYRQEHPIYDAWRDTRTKLAQLMQAYDFAVLANFYEELELLDNIMRSDNINADLEQAKLRLETCYKRRPDAMRVVDGYCDARWRLFAGWVTGDIE